MIKLINLKVDIFQIEFHKSDNCVSYNEAIDFKFFLPYVFWPTTYLRKRQVKNFIFIFEL